MSDTSMVCEFNSVNGNNTSVITRRGKGKSYPKTGYLIKKNCPNGKFKIDISDGGTNDYYKLLNPGQYLGIDASGPVYVWISSSYLKYPTPAQVREAAAKLNNSKYSMVNFADTTTSTVDNITTSTGYNQGLDDQIYNFLESTKIKNLMKTNTRVFGNPFQFTNIADNRPFASDDLNYGRKYLENIIAEAPIIYITPGLPDYMPDADKNTRDKMDSYIKARSSGSVDDDILTSVLGTNLRYYGFVSAYAEYTRYVNLLCRVSAQYMGIGDKTVPGTTETYKNYDWGRWTNIGSNGKNSSKTTRVGIFEKVAGKFEDLIEGAKDTIVDELFGEYKYVKCYVDPSASFSESGSNTSQPSQIAGLFDSLEGIVKEVGFFSNGSGIAKSVIDTATGATSSIANSVTGVLDSDVSTGLSKIIGNATHVLSGSNVIFPELWGDSQYNKSYSFSMNLISPYGDPESVYINIIVPMMHLLALSMPRQTSANSFGSPFLVKIFAKGWFSCELGMVESITIEKDPSSWNVHGLPNEVKINMTVKDLYTNLMISKSTTPGLFFSNQGLIEFLAVTCGLNITQGDIGLKLDTILQTYLNTLTDIPSNLYDTVIQSIRNAIEGWFKITR